MMNDRRIAPACRKKALSRRSIAPRWHLVLLLILVGSMGSASASLAQPTPSASPLSPEEIAMLEKQATDSIASLTPFLVLFNDTTGDVDSQVDLLVETLGPQLVADHYDFEALEREDQIHRLRQLCTWGMLLIILLVIYKRRRETRRRMSENA